MRIAPLAITAYSAWQGAALLLAVCGCQTSSTSEVASESLETVEEDYLLQITAVGFREECVLTTMHASVDGTAIGRVSERKECWSDGIDSDACNEPQATHSTTGFVERPLSEEEYRSVRSAIDRSGVWQGQRLESGGGIDGWHIRLEGRRGENCFATTSFNPTESGRAYGAAEALARLSAALQQR